MATTLIGRRYQTTISDSYSDGLEQSYEVVYIVKVDDDCDDEASVLSTSGLPAVGDESEVITGTYCISRSATESSEGGYWDVVVSYSNQIPSGGGSGGGGKPGSNPDGSPDGDQDGPPWLRGGTYTLGSGTMSEYASTLWFCGVFDPKGQAVDGGPACPPRWKNRTGIPAGLHPRFMVANTLGEPIHYDTTVHYVTFKYSRALLNIDFARLWPYVGCANEDEVTLNGIKFEQYQVKIEDLTADIKQWNNVFYWDVSFTAACVSRDQGWRTEFANVGTHYATGEPYTANTQWKPSSKGPLVDDAGDPVVGPIDYFGVPAKPEDEQVWLYYLEHQPKELGPFFNYFRR